MEGVLPHNFCDRCGKKYKNGKSFYEIEFGYNDYPSKTMVTGVSLCRKCYKKFSKRFDKWVNKE